MPADLITSDDLDALGFASFDADDPMGVVGQLVAAVDEGRLADVADTAYALSLAAEIAERQGELDRAVALAARAAEASHARGDDYGHPRALYGELLIRSGREDEGLSVLAALRPLLTRDEDAIYYVSEALEQADRTDVAVQWLTAALDAALQRRSAVASRRGDRVYEQAAVIAYGLAQVRHRLRRELDLPHDEHDLLADQLRDAVDEVFDPDEDGQDTGTAVLFWPRAEFDALQLRWPRLAQEYGGSWDEHRARLQRGLVLMAQSGPARWELLDGTLDGLAGFASQRGSDPADPDVRQGYVEHLDRARPHRRPWPPQRNDTCWCGSGVKYKKCCLLRSRS